ncbi:MAG: phasin family protein [Pikeienuella sp.]
MTARKTTARKTAEAAFDASTVAEGAREYVQRAAADAKARTDSAYEGALRFNAGLEKTMSRMVSGYVGVLGDIAEATRANLVDGFAAMEKAAAAKNMGEALRIQGEFLRANAEANLDRARNAASATRDVVAEGVEALRDGVSDIWAESRKAA